MSTAREVARAAAGDVLPRLLGLALLAGLWLVLSCTRADADLGVPGPQAPVSTLADAVPVTEPADSPAGAVAPQGSAVVNDPVHVTDRAARQVVERTTQRAVERTADGLRHVTQVADETTGTVGRVHERAAAAVDDQNPPAGRLPRLPAPPDPTPALAPAGPALAAPSLDLLGDSRLARGTGSDPSEPVGRATPTAWALAGGLAPHPTAPAPKPTLVAPTDAPLDPAPHQRPDRPPSAAGTTGAGPSGLDRLGPVAGLLTGTAFGPAGLLPMLVARVRRRPRSSTSRPGSSPD